MLGYVISGTQERRHRARRRKGERDGGGAGARESEREGRKRERGEGGGGREVRAFRTVLFARKGDNAVNGGRVRFGESGIYDENSGRPLRLRRAISGRRIKILALSAHSVVIWAREASHGCSSGNFETKGKVEKARGSVELSGDKRPSYRVSVFARGEQRAEEKDGKRGGGGGGGGWKK